ncbi:hypothetical protein L227DRAFT_121360 [Lentinus tigrinus ALCF2SS1-6]|uniref:Uncharacterized protein n=1 Tax=Lentinus tigrinus ALCF2SS1-6 TaxID=1328759 RepID=A0A5C2SRV2_9APHY|nr:hypothetical protein L227DRAFT_121360 [Lentinus tigrinus ALCF2SS1-6]
MNKTLSARNARLLDVGDMKIIAHRYLHPGTHVCAIHSILTWTNPICRTARCPESECIYVESSACPSFESYQLCSPSDFNTDAAAATRGGGERDSGSGCERRISAAGRWLEAQRLNFYRYTWIPCTVCGSTITGFIALAGLRHGLRRSAHKQVIAKGEGRIAIVGASRYPDIWEKQHTALPR